MLNYLRFRADLDSAPRETGQTVPKNVKQMFHAIVGDPETPDQCVDAILKLRAGGGIDRQSLSEWEKRRLTTLETELHQVASQSDWYEKRVLCKKS
jgi:hypothetical protein